MVMAVMAVVAVMMMAHAMVLAAAADAVVGHRGGARWHRGSLRFIDLRKSGGGKGQSKACASYQKNAGARSNRHGNSPLDKTVR